MCPASGSPRGSFLPNLGLAGIEFGLPLPFGLGVGGEAERKESQDGNDTAFHQNPFLLARPPE